MPKLDESTDRRVLRTRQLIFAAFDDLLVEKGLAEISIQDLAGRAGVNRATFYAHFTDKFAVLNQRVREGFASEIAKRDLGSRELCQGLLLDLIRTLAQYVEVLISRAKPDASDWFPETGITDLTRELLATDARAESQDRAVAASWALYGLCLAWARRADRQPIESFAQSTLPIVWSLVAPTEPN